MGRASAERNPWWGTRLRLWERTSGGNGEAVSAFLLLFESFLSTAFTTGK